VTTDFLLEGSGQLIQQSDDRQLQFSLQFTDSSFSQSLGVPAVYTGDDLFVRASLIPTPFLQDVRVSVRSCWATYGDEETQHYQLVTNRCVDDSTFLFATPYYTQDPLNDHFAFKSFRFYVDSDNYSQPVWLHCMLVACEEGDFSSLMCTDTCPDDLPVNRRSRRAPIRTGLLQDRPAQNLHMLRQEIRYLGDRSPLPKTKSGRERRLACALVAASTAVLLMTSFLVVIVVRWEYLLETRYKQKLSLRIKLFSAGAHEAAVSVITPPTGNFLYK
jgi:hypothetical protein